MLHFLQKFKGGEITDWGEWQANILTSYLLMPKELVFQHMKRVGLEHGIHRLNRKFAPREYSLFSDVADSLGVSKTALFIRLKKLGLIEKENFFNPYDYAKAHMTQHLQNAHNVQRVYSSHRFHSVWRVEGGRYTAEQVHSIQSTCFVRISWYLKDTI